MATKKKFKPALIGTDSLRGREIKNTLGQKKFAAFDLEFYGAEVQEEYSKLTEFMKEPKVIHGMDADIPAFEAIFRKAAAFKLTAFRESCSASSITVSGKDEIFVGRIKKEESGPRTFWVRLVADNVTRGSALNAVEIAKKILKARSA